MNRINNTDTNTNTNPIKLNTPSSNNNVTKKILSFALKPPQKKISVFQLNEDEEDTKEGGGEYRDNNTSSKRQKRERNEEEEHSLVPEPPDSDVKSIIDKMAPFVAKSGSSFEDVAKKKNMGNPKFNFLFDMDSKEYKYYQYKLMQEKRALSTIPTTPSTTTTSTTNRNETDEEKGSLARMEQFYKTMQQAHKKETNFNKGDPSALPEEEEDAGHHIGDFLPKDELGKYMGSADIPVPQPQPQQIGADNKGHQLLMKMGWKEGSGLGSKEAGIAAPIQAAPVKLDTTGLGMQNPSDVNEGDDIYDQYKKRMMQSYKYRPNPLNNPRRSYY